jgi:hypothetical protein
VMVQGRGQGLVVKYNGDGERGQEELELELCLL